MIPRTPILFSVFALGIGLVETVHAAVFTAIDGSAIATITAAPSGPNTNLTIVLTNTTPTASTTSAGNLLTGLELTPQDISTYSLQSQTASKEFVFSTQTTGAISNGTYNPHWALDTSPAHSLYFNGFGNGGLPIIGPAAGGTTYAGADSSLTAGPHGTFIYETATFVVQAPGSFNPNTITGVTFLFNTDGSITVGGAPSSGSIPEPASLGLMGFGAVGLLMKKRRRVC